MDEAPTSTVQGVVVQSVPVPQLQAPKQQSQGSVYLDSTPAASSSQTQIAPEQNFPSLQFGSRTLVLIVLGFTMLSVAGFLVGVLIARVIVPALGL